MSFKMIIAVLFIFVICLFLVIFFFYNRYNNNYFSNRSIKSFKVPIGEIHGIDISHYCGQVNFKKVKEQGFTFVFIRSTMGKNRTDNQFHYNRRKAQLEGLKWGCYHFFDFSDDGISQAKHLINNLHGHQPDLPLVIDVEEEGFNTSTVISVEQVKKEVTRCIDYLQSCGFKHIMVYSNEIGYRKYLRGHTNNYYLWIASTKSYPNVDRHWTFQQYLLDEPLLGAQNKVDYNRFYGDINAWNAFLNEVAM